MYTFYAASIRFDFFTEKSLVHQGDWVYFFSVSDKNIGRVRLYVNTEKAYFIMIKLQEGGLFSHPDLLTKDNIYCPVCIMMQSMHTNVEGKPDNFH